MTYILNIETSTKNCSVSICKNDTIVSIVEHVSENFEHSEKLSLFIDEAISKANIAYKDLSAVCVAKGPGSYTGLRIGVSTAKGLCYALNIPLLSVPTTEVLVRTYLNTNNIADNDVVCAMIDARRMEVFCAFYNKLTHALSPIKSVVVDEHFAQEYTSEKVHFIGDIAHKIKDVITVSDYEIVDLYPSASAMGEIAFIKFKENAFEDVAYFEPFYLKEFYTP